jgi:hypothetical protein
MTEDTKKPNINPNDADIGMGGIDRLNSGNGKTEILRENEIGGRPFTLDDYNKALEDAAAAQKKQENIMSEETQQVKRADMINAQNKVSDNEQIDTGEELPKNPSGIQIAMRPKTAVNIMRCQFPAEIITELNSHIKDTIIPNNVDHSKGLVGQISQHKRSAQLTFPYEDDEVGEMFSGVLQRLAKEYVDRTIGIECETSMESMWTVHSYSGDYNPVHDHGTQTPMGVSCIMYLQVPRCIQTLSNPSEEFGGLNESSGNVDGFTYLTWGSNGMRDINMMRPITEEYIKPEVGTLIMFPSWLRHGVMPFFSPKEDDERRTFSANINIKLNQRVSGDHYRKDRT